LSLTVWLSPSVGLAAPVKHVELFWSTGSPPDPRCLAAAVLEDTVERTLGRPVFHTPAAAFARIVGSVVAIPPQAFEARIVLQQEDGAVLAERTLVTSGECGRLDESIAVVITLMIDGLEERPTVLAVPVEPPRPTPATLPGPLPLSLSLALLGGASSSLVPGVSASVGLRGEVQVGGFVPVALTLRTELPTTALVDGSGARFSAFTGELAACPAWSRRWLRLGACGGVGMGVLTASAEGLREHSPSQPIPLLSVLPFVGLRVGGPIWIRAEVGAWFPLLRERWGFFDTSDTYVTVHRAGAAVPTAALGLEVRTGS
jgi:hypothetical protein